jgi:hypothetical protein
LGLTLRSEFSLPFHTISCHLDFFDFFWKVTICISPLHIDPPVSRPTWQHAIPALVAVQEEIVPGLYSLLAGAGGVPKSYVRWEIPVA